MRQDVCDLISRTTRTSLVQMKVVSAPALASLATRIVNQRSDQAAFQTENKSRKALKTTSNPAKAAQFEADVGNLASL